MKNLNTMFGRLVREEEGAAASEYAILVAIIAGIVATAVAAFDLTGIFTAAGDKVKEIMGVTPPATGGGT